VRTLLVIFTLLLLLSVGCRPSESPEEFFAKLEAQWKPPTERSDSPVTAAQIVECSQHMGIYFSTNTIPLGYKKMTGGMDDALFLKVRIPHNEVGAFIAASPLARESFDELAALPGANSLAPWWWNFMRKRQVRYGQTSLPKGEALHMLIDPESESSVIVYLVWHQT
jgi:hypothetical protein